MMPDLSHIPLQELYDDRRDSLEDIALCQQAIDEGIFTYTHGDEEHSVQKRLDTNRAIIDVIDAELKRRPQAAHPPEFVVAEDGS
jgi:hypothetical protein